MNDTPQEYPSFDALIQDDQLHILKTALCYVKIPEQRFLSVYVKLLELQKTIRFFQSDEETLSACSLPRKDGNLFDFLKDIRKYCPPDQQDHIDQILNFSNMYQTFQTYQAMAKEFEQFNESNHAQSADTAYTSSPSDIVEEHAMEEHPTKEHRPQTAGVNENINYLKNMLPPEQRGVIELLLSNRTE